MKNYLRLLRPKHYVKNVLVLLPLFFSGRFFERMPLCVGLLGFAAFCLLSSLVYIVNDLRDAPADRLHPTKCRRPIASGAVGVPSALALAAALGAGLGFTVALLLFAGVETKIDDKYVPAAFRGFPVRLLAAGVICMAVVAFK